MLVVVGVRVTVDSVSVVVVDVVAGSVAQDDKAMTQTGITGIKRISFFITRFDADKPDSMEVTPADGIRSETLAARAPPVSQETGRNESTAGGSASLHLVAARSCRWH